MHLDETEPLVPITILARPSQVRGSGRVESGSLTEMAARGKPKVAKCHARRPVTAASAGADRREFGLPKGWVGMP
jgi:hypothetical protein